MVNTWWMNERLNQHVNTDRNATQSREMHSKTCNTKLRWPTFATQNTSLRSNKNKTLYYKNWKQQQQQQEEQKTNNLATKHIAVE